MALMIYTIVFLSQHMAVLSQINSNNFGPYDLKFEKFVTCKGPKPRNCGKVQLENTNNMDDVIFVMDFAQDCPVTKARVTIGIRQENNSTKKLWNYSLDNPCQHFVLGPILVGSFNLTNSCKVNKGSYKIHMNMTEKCIEFLGPSFFYSRYVFKVMAHSNVNNFFCVENHIGISKKKDSSPESKQHE